MANSGHSGVDPYNKDLVLYERLRDMFLKGEVKVSDIVKELNVGHTSAETMISNLSVELPIWSPGRGVYKVLCESDIENYRQKLRAKNEGKAMPVLCEKV